MTELRNCPFCGSADIIITSNGTGSEFAECQGCGASGPAEYTVRGAEHYWNTRAVDGLVTELVDIAERAECKYREATPDHTPRVGFCADYVKATGGMGCSDCTALTHAREAGYGSNLQKMQIGQDGE